ncbi:uncharacterized protein LOC131679714 [Topomyia yanbarensis]|uniref:uncharacterized protein LOC131679714 n=1 Tax=Topomyia yanbarensis TaxID=2498891 RepID=UPI00273AFD21|nr:uncharacterized protein LOC131679714 [Topomyia yanbarensis]
MHICNGGKHSKVPDLKTPEATIQKVRTAKILGVQVDSRLTFMKHADNLVKECQNRLLIIKEISRRYAAGNRQTLLKVCDSILLSKISPGFGLYSRGGEKVIKPIQPIYHSAIRTISRALITSPIISLIAESGQLPFDYVMTGRLVGKAYSWLEKRPVEEDQVCPMTRSASKWLEQMTTRQIPTISTLNSISNRAWDAENPAIDWSIKNQTRAHEAPSKIQAIFSELRTNKYSKSAKFFTDGSLDRDSVGLGIHSENIEISMRIPNCCTIFSAEALALLVATENAPISKHAVVFSDSQAAYRR